MSKMCLTGLKIPNGAAAGLHSSLKALVENLFSCVFLVLKAACVPWPMVHLSVPSQQWSIKCHHSNTYILPSSLLFKGSYCLLYWAHLNNQ